MKDELVFCELFCRYVSLNEISLEPCVEIATVFTFMFLLLRCSKLDPMLIGFDDFCFAIIL